MSATLLMTFLILFMMVQRLFQTYMGGRYVCPSCGARSQSSHSSDCPWSHTPSE